MHNVQETIFVIHPQVHVQKQIYKQLPEVVVILLQITDVLLLLSVYRQQTHV